MQREQQRGPTAKDSGSGLWAQGPLLTAMLILTWKQRPPFPDPPSPRTRGSAGACALGLPVGGVLTSVSDPSRGQQGPPSSSLSLSSERASTAGALGGFGLGDKGRAVGPSSWLGNIGESPSWAVQVVLQSPPACPAPQWAGRVGGRAASFPGGGGGMTTSPCVGPPVPLPCSCF